MTKGYDALRSHPSDMPLELTFSPNPAYEQYLRIHKVLVGPKTAQTLEKIAYSLGEEKIPKYLVTAGWAITEASLAQPHLSAHERNNLFDHAEEWWLEAIDTQMRYIDQGKEHLVEASAPYRTALDIARLPLLRGMVLGSITPSLRKNVRDETLAIMNASWVQANLALRQGDIESFNDFVGFAHEGNSLIALDSFNSDSLFGMTSFARSDSGYHHPEQTHDIVIVQQKKGLLKSMTPVEIKSKVSQNDRKRYKALLVRGKMHLCLAGEYSPNHTLKAFTALNENSQTLKEKATTDTVRQTFIDMFWQYKCGSVLVDIATSRSRMHFRDRTQLHQKYPEIAAS